MPIATPTPAPRRPSRSCVLRALLCAAALALIASSGHAQDRSACQENAPPDAALAACDRALAAPGLSARERAALVFNRAVAWGRKRNFANAIRDFDEAIRLDPRAAKAYNWRGNARRSKGDPAQAIADYDRAIALDPRDANVFVNRGIAWADQREYDRAIADYSEAARLDPKSFSAYYNRALAWRRKGDLDRALADYDEAIRLNPQAVRAYVGRGIVRSEKKDLDGGIADFDAAIGVDPKYAAAYVARSVAWRRKRDFARSIADADEALRLDPKNAEAYFSRAYAEREKGDLDAAIADYGEAIRYNPKYVGAYNNRGGIWRTRKEFDRAVADYTAAVQIDPTYVAALTGRGLAYEGKGERERARANFSAALGLPEKYDNGKWAHDTARARLAVLAPREPVEPTAPPAAGPARDRLALVIGNGAYVNAAKLPNPPNDARAVAQALRGIGFSTIEAIDLDQRGMERAVLDFLRQAAAARVALLFYAGHAVAIDGRNYLVPTDAKEVSRSTANFELIDVDRILAGLDDEARANIVILDACRDNPLETRVASRSGSRGSGLAAYSSVASGMLIAFATAPGKTALDGSGTHSPFTAALLKHIATPGIEVNQMLTRVRVDVAAATERAQVPWVNSSLMGEIYLTGDPRAVGGK